MTDLAAKVVVFGRFFVLLGVYAKGLVMKRFFFLLLCCAAWAAVGAVRADSVLLALDKVLSQQEVYMKAKEVRIDSLKRLLGASSLSPEQQLVLNRKLGMEYELFVSDSAMKYVDRSLDLAEELGNATCIDEARLRQVAVFSVSGLYKEAVETLHRIDRSTMDDTLLPGWYNAARQLNSFLAVYSHKEPHMAEYNRLHALYRDSLMGVLPPTSPEYRLYRSEQLAATGQYAQARQVLQQLMNSQPETSNLYGRAAFSLALIYKVEGNTSGYEKLLALSAISDIKSSVKENAALQNLAIALFERGDVGRAYHYIKYSLQDAVFCNARQRTVEVSGMLPVIDAAYRLQTEKARKQLVLFLALVSVLSLTLIVAVVLVYKQMKKLSATRRKLQQANLIKEEYIGHFLNLCSLYIEKLDTFRRTVNRKLTAGQTEELLRLTKSSQYAGMEQKEFYAHFDSAFLHLYPRFVEELNGLLQPTERFVLKPGELLNTEMRIFAFIRLGIDDSSKIANFLHYSINTIYTYRNKVKNRAIDRDTFEEEILRIGAV